MNDEEKESVKQKIISSTLELIGNEGVDEITVRKVAKNSSVNVAAINYYFGSKEKLVEESINHFFEDKIVTIFQVLDNENYNTEQKLYHFFINYINELAKNPGFPKSLLTYILEGKIILLDKIKTLKTAFSKLYKLISVHTEITDEKLLTIKVMHLISAVIFPMAMTDFYPKIIDKISLSDEETRELYIKHLLKSILDINI